MKGGAIDGLTGAAAGSNGGLADLRERTPSSSRRRGTASEVVNDKKGVARDLRGAGPPPPMRMRVYLSRVGSRGAWTASIVNDGSRAKRAVS